MLDEFFFLWSHKDLDATKVLDNLPLFNESPCRNGRLMRDNCVSIRSSDFESAVW